MFIDSRFGCVSGLPELKGRLCTYLGGFSLHIAISVSRHQRDKLNKLIRYTAHLSVSTKRISLTKNGDIKDEIKKLGKME